jgi:predicted DNA-binding transcriptional regulator YafY
MRRADRLFLIINSLRGRRTATPARRLAESLQVSLRTIYRDVADLQLSGVPIEGEAGVGYLLRKGADIPPLMFTADELEALVVGSRFAQAFVGARLAEAAHTALIKIEAVAPPALRDRAAGTRIFAPYWRDEEDRAMRLHLDVLHAAIAVRQVIAFDYSDRRGATSHRFLEPLCLSFWGCGWTLGGWCRLRRDFRSFRIDRMASTRAISETFAAEPGRDLDAYIAATRADFGGLDA